MALGIELVAHLEPILDEERFRAGFCVRSAPLAELLCATIRAENVEAMIARGHPAATQDDACDVLLPCDPRADDDEINSVVVAATKAAHRYFCATPP